MSIQKSQPSNDLFTSLLRNLAEGMLLLSAGCAFFLATGCVNTGGWVDEPVTFDPRTEESLESAPGSPRAVREQGIGAGTGFDTDPGSSVAGIQEGHIVADGDPAGQAQPGPAALEQVDALDLADGELAPVEIFVLPIRDESRAFDAPLGVLRQALADGLVERRYSPLSLEYGDQILAEAASAGALDTASAVRPLGADALLQVRLGEWNTDLLESRGILRAEIELFLWRGSDPQSTALWTGKVEREVGVPARNLRSTPKAELEADCARRLVGLLLEGLPPRT